MTPNPEQVVEALSQSRPLAGLQPAALLSFVEACTTHKYAEGDIILKRGVESTVGHILVAGCVEIEDQHYPGRVRSSQVFRPGSLFGASGLIQSWPSWHQCRAQEDSTVLVLKKDAFLNLMNGKNPVVLRLIDDLMHMLVDEVRQVNAHFDELHSRPDQTLQTLRELVHEDA